MKKYFVLKYDTNNNEHIKEEDLLPADCKLITGITVNATSKKDIQTEEIVEKLSFPQYLIIDNIREINETLFYSFMQSRDTELESRTFFESDILPEITSKLKDILIFPKLDNAQQSLLSQRLEFALGDLLPYHLFNVIDIYEKGKILSSFKFSELVAEEVLMFLYSKKDEIFIYNKQVYIQANPYECGNISLLVNGNSFLLRDYTITANREVKQVSKEIIKFNEPLEVNSSLSTVFKNYKNSIGNLTIRIYIEYEYERTTTHNS